MTAQYLSYGIVGPTHSDRELEQQRVMELARSVARRDRQRRLLGR
jgi:hypothetical protein